jgi:hypothetical protein
MSLDEPAWGNLSNHDAGGGTTRCAVGPLGKAPPHQEFQATRGRRVFEGGEDKTHLGCADKRRWIASPSSM